MTNTSSHTNQTVDLLWTGGWDSTFRLLESIFALNQITQTWYIIDRQRQSTHEELETISKITKTLINRRVADLFPPTKIYLRDQIPRDEEVETSFDQIRQQVRIGEQYKWLAEFAKSQNKTNFEMGLPRHIESTPLYDFIFIHNPKKQSHPELQLSEEIDIQNIFKWYRFPIIERTKHDYLEIARKNGFEDILTMSWFCHRPILGQPCGLCHPCKQAREQGRDLRFSHFWPFAYVKRRYYPRFRRLARRITGSQT